MKLLSSLVRHPGNVTLFRAAEMSVLATRDGYPFHLHAEGVRGTGKTTILRAARALLPLIERVRGCLYNCSPGAPHCPAHRRLDPQEIAALGTELVPMPFLEVSPSAKVGTVAGSIDLARITDPCRPQAALLPGTIPQAHRGILFVDEINRLADTAPELADVLLDVMGTRPGRIQVEEIGLPRVEMPVTVSVWAASNPDEEPGPLEEIRRQLSDRFDLVVSVRRPGRRELVEQILCLNDPWPALLPVPAAAEEVPAALPAGVLGRTRIPPELRALIASLYVEFGLESLRAVEALEVGSRLAAALAGREAVEVEDLLFVAPLALEHRVEPQTLPRVLRFLEAWREEAAGGGGHPLGGGGAGGRGGPGSPPGQGRPERAPAAAQPQAGGPVDASQSQPSGAGGDGPAARGAAGSAGPPPSDRRPLPGAWGRARSALSRLLSRLRLGGRRRQAAAGAGGTGGGSGGGGSGGRGRAGGTGDAGGTGGRDDAGGTGGRDDAGGTGGRGDRASAGGEGSAAGDQDAVGAGPAEGGGAGEGMAGGGAGEGRAGAGESRGGGGSQSSGPGRGAGGGSQSSGPGRGASGGSQSSGPGRGASGGSQSSGPGRGAAPSGEDTPAQAGGRQAGDAGAGDTLPPPVLSPPHRARRLHELAPEEMVKVFRAGQKG